MLNCYFCFSCPSFTSFLDLWILFCPLLDVFCLIFCTLFILTQKDFSVFALINWSREIVTVCSERKGFDYICVSYSTHMIVYGKTPRKNIKRQLHFLAICKVKHPLLGFYVEPKVMISPEA